MRSSLFDFSRTTWKRGMWCAGPKGNRLTPALTGFRLQCFSTRRTRASRSPKMDPQPPVNEEIDAFYVVRKGDTVGIYKSLSDCQAQVSSLVCDPPVSVYKGYSLRKESEEYLASRGFKNALYSMSAADVNDDLFGTLVPCPFQQPDGLAFLVDKSSQKSSTKKRSKEVETVDFGSISTEQSQKHIKVEHPIEVQPLGSRYMTCILEFDGASKGNPGKAGAGAVLRSADGSVISRLREGLGIATNNVAEYRGLILGMKFALKKGYKKIKVQGDSKLVCMQVQDIWQTKHQNMAELCKEVKKLKDMFLSFEISHVLRDLNSDADAQANLGVNLPVGEVNECCGEIV